MDSRLSETDLLLCIATALILGVDRAMDRLLSLLPTAARAPAPSPAPAPLPGPGRAEDTAIQQALDEVLEYYRTHWPKNTAKNYKPKQREWKAGAGPPALGSAWCKKMGFKEGDKYLPGDYIDKGKLLLFIKDKVASRAPKKGRCHNADRQYKGKGKRQAELPLLPSRLLKCWWNSLLIG
ncbi:hypothetical protein OIDMADRAFT_127050 [Oidiodendron maius Zn]|uniref:Uncharacterized protein n=1 Tax=Oidiodendron maius (strain Zn) TaxID=913774 RepID=A0A0C3DBP4_OIDMZ|nr:hypothetical protein OIDMADRAFT_127050 [Oidiodendron maius Zn]